MGWMSCSPSFQGGRRETPESTDNSTPPPPPVEARSAVEITTDTFFLSPSRNCPRPDVRSATRAGAQPVSNAPNPIGSSSSRPGSSSGSSGWHNGNGGTGYGAYSQKQQRGYSGSESIPVTAPLNYRPTRTAPLPPPPLSTSTGQYGLDDEYESYDSPIDGGPGGSSGSGSHHNHRNSFGTSSNPLPPTPSSVLPSSSSAASSSSHPLSVYQVTNGGRPPIFPSASSSSIGIGAAGGAGSSSSAFQPSRPAPPLPQSGGSYVTSQTPTTSPGRYHAPLPSVGSGDSQQTFDGSPFGYNNNGWRQAPPGPLMSGSQQSLRELGDALPAAAEQPNSIPYGQQQQQHPLPYPPPHQGSGAHVATPHSSSSSLAGTGSASAGGGSNSYSLAQSSSYGHGHQPNHHLLPDSSSSSLEPQQPAVDYYNNGSSTPSLTGPGPPQTPGGGGPANTGGEGQQRFSGDREGGSSTAASTPGGGVGSASGSGTQAGTVKEGKRSKGFGSFLGAFFWRAKPPLLLSGNGKCC